MGRLTDRVRARQEAERESRLAQELAERYSRAVDRLSSFEDDQDRQLALRYGLYSRLAEEFLEREEDQDPDDPPERGQPERRLYHWHWGRGAAPKALTEPVERPIDPLQQIRKEAEADRRNNVLYQLWMEQRLQRGPLDLELEEFSEAVAGRALVRLLAYVPRGAALLQSVAPEDPSPWIPQPELVRRFVDAGGLVETDDQRFLARLFAEVPGSRRALFRLLGAYKLVVRAQAERDGQPMAGELPGEDYGRELVTWDQLGRLLGAPATSFERAYGQEGALARAVARYLEGDALETAAQSAGVSRGRLRSRLVDLQLLRRRGRPRSRYDQRPESQRRIFSKSKKESAPCPIPATGSPS